MNNYDIDTLVAIKSSFQSNDFQWIKTNDKTKLGKVVQVRDVLPSRNGRFMAILSDGTQLDTDRVSSDLMMITEDQKPMSMAEIQSINYIPSLNEDFKVSEEIPAEFRAEVIAPKQIAPQPAQPAQLKVSNDPGDLFGMFSLEDTDLALSVKIKLPSKNLLKMMYSNSKNKEEFLTKLSDYINNNVTADSIKKTMKKMLSTTPTKKSTANA
ncbi:hypothetical protein UFOVP1604_2 [uncultured Caudovirales phage]|uniref:Uncharacterized protein n=1 Tax=uncultured Caudovirales phage TaxID=2100421 RepID=A0A6J5SS42_9CAUD|nr:hypothetical protein UFOVP1604_2 [uncultured Caudovirales phage]